MQDSESPIAFIRSFAAALSSQPGQARSREDILDAVERNVMIENLTASVVGVSWRKATPDQRTRLCAAILGRVARSMALPFKELPDATLWGERVSGDGDRCQVSARLQSRTGISIAISWRLLRNGGGLRIFDASIDGISIVESLRAQFHATITQGGVDGLIAQLDAMSS